VAQVFYWVDGVPVTEPTASENWRKLETPTQTKENHLPALSF